MCTSERALENFIFMTPQACNKQLGLGGGGRGKGLQGAPFFAMGVGGALPKSMGAHKLHKRKSEHRRRKVYFCGFERAKRARKK